MKVPGAVKRVIDFNVRVRVKLDVRARSDVLLGSGGKRSGDLIKWA